MFGFFKKQQEEDQDIAKNYFSILLSQRLVQAALWTIENGMVTILSKSTLKPYFNEADCLVKLDECLQELGSAGESVSDTIFHLDSSFADVHGIYADKKEFFKNILSSLQLTSIGFVSNTEAVVGAKLEENGENIKQMIIEFTKEQTLFSLFEGKKQLGSYLAKNDVALNKQFATACVDFKDYLPVAYAVTTTETTEEAVASSSTTDIPMLNVSLISALLSTDELNTKEDSFPEELPLKLSYIGSDIILPVVLIPGATAIARAKGWIVTGSDEANLDAAPVVNATTMTADTPTVEEATAKVNQKVNQEEKPAKPIKPKKPLNPKPLIIGGVIVGVLVAALIIFYVVVGGSMATVTIQPQEKVLSKTIEITVDPTATESDFENLILAGSMEEETVDGSVTVAVTGTKEIGEPATGTVTIINKKTSEQKFSAGTTLTTSDGLKFTLDNDVTVEAAEEKDNGRTYKEKDAKVTASEIGKESNIASDKSLKIAAYSTDDFEAKSKDEFTGGLSEEVAVVTAADQKKALDELTAQLADEVKNLQTKDGDSYLVPIVSGMTLANRQYSAELDEEAKELTLTATATVPVVAYDSKDLQPLAVAVLEKEVPEGYSLSGEPELMSAVSEDEASGSTSSKSLTLEADLSSIALANVDLNDLQEKLLGQEVIKAQNILKDEPAVKAYEITWSNNLYETLYGALPKKADKLEVTIYNDGNELQ